MLKLFLEYYGEYADAKYNDIHLYDEDGVFMTFRDCHITLVKYEGSKSIKTVNSTMDICPYLHEAIDLIDKAYKVSEDSFYTNNMHWHIDGKIRLARKFDLTKKDNFSFETQRKDSYGVYAGRNRDLYIYAPKDETLDTNCLDTSYSDKMVTAYRDVARLIGNITVNGTYYQYLQKDAPFEGKVFEKSKFTDGHKCVTNKVTRHKIENFSLFITSDNVTIIDGELREKSKRLAEAIKEKTNSFRFKDITYSDVEAILQHFDITEK